MSLPCALFDLDGTLALTDELHDQAWTATLARRGTRLEPGGYATEIRGRSNADIVARLLPQLSVTQGMAVAEEKEALFRRLASRGLQAPAGLGRLLARLTKHGVQLGVVTNAPRDNAVHILRGVGLAGSFATVVSVEDVEVPKPSPEPYTLGLQRLGGSSKRCVAFEDSPSGVQAAAAAELPIVALLTGHEPNELQKAGAEVLVQDFTDPRLHRLIAERLGLPYQL